MATDDAISDICELLETEVILLRDVVFNNFSIYLNYLFFELIEVFFVKTVPIQIAWTREFINKLSPD
jgi:hypothetical protein